MDMIFNEPPELRPGDEVEVVTDIRRHDIVCWERVGENKLIMRTLAPSEVATYPGRKFRIDKGESGSLIYIEVGGSAPGKGDTMSGQEPTPASATAVEPAAQSAEALRRHRQVYATKALPAFNYNWVTNRIMAGRNPLTCHDVEMLRTFGITHILDLREPHEWTPPRFGAEAVEAIERCGLQRVNIVVRDVHAPTLEAFDAAYRFLEQTLAHADTRIYVHCRAGAERTAAILVAFYARYHGVSYDEALSRLREGRPLLAPLSHQEKAVREWLKLQPQRSNQKGLTETPFTIVWDGITRSILLTEEALKLRHRLSDAAKNYEWKRTLEILSHSPELVNVTRPDGSSLYTPLHQAAHGGAPVEIIEQLISLGAWRTVRNARGERPLEVAERQQQSHLYILLTPQYQRPIALDELQQIQRHFHEVIRGRISELDHVDTLRLPELEPLLEYAEAKAWFAVPGMYGGFHYWLETGGADTRLISESWCRVAGGSGQRHEVTSTGSRMTDEGFV